MGARRRRVIRSVRRDGSAVRAGPFEHAGSGLFDGPAAVVLDRVMPSTEMRKVVWRARAAVFPGDGVVDVTPSGVSVAGGEPAVTVSCGEVSPQTRGRTVGVGRNDHPGHGMRQ